MAEHEPTHASIDPHATPHLSDHPTPSDSNLPAPTAENRGGQGTHAPGIAGHATFEEDTIDISAIVKLGAALLLAVVVSIIICIFIFRGLEKLDQKNDVQPSPLAELQPPVPQPRLEASPRFDLLDLASEQDARLNGMGFDPQSQTWHVPIQVAMNYVLQNGLPKPATTQPVGGQGAPQGTTPASAPAKVHPGQ